MTSRSAVTPLLSALLLSLLLLTTAACGPGEEETADPSAALWSEVEALEADLEAKRQEIADLESRLEAAAAAAEGEDDTAGEATEDEASATEGDEGEAAEELGPEEIQAQIDQLRGEVQTLSEDFYAKLVEYINTSGIVEGQPLTPEQEKAFQWKAEEDILIAEEYIDKAGDYAEAIRIYEQALMNDPENESLLAAKAEAEDLRYMDEERFSQVKKGMSQDEVRELLGTVKRSNERDYPERNMIGWFYPKGNRAAAGVFFKEKDQGEGNWVVSVMDFDAVEAQTAGGGDDG